MGRTVRAKDEKSKIPFKKCENPGCTNHRRFYYAKNKNSICSGCKNILCPNDQLPEIVSSTKIYGSIRKLKSILELKNSANNFNIGITEEGKDCFKGYQSKLEDISKRFTEADDNDQVEEYIKINNEFSNLKNEFASCEEIKPFLIQNFRAELDVEIKSCSVSDSSSSSDDSDSNESDSIKSEKESIQKPIIKEKECHSCHQISSELKEIKDQLKVLNRRIGNFEKSNGHDNSVLSIERTTKYSIEKSNIRTFTPNTNSIENKTLYINMEKESDKVYDLLDLCKPLTYDKVFFNNIPERNKDLHRLLMSTFPKNPLKFSFGWENSNIYVIDYYLDGLVNVLKEMTNEVFVCKWDFSQLSLERFIKASSNCSKLVIRHSMLDFDDTLDFSGPAYKILYFSLERCGGCFDAKCNGMCNDDEWRECPDKFRHIIKAISESSMKDSLQTFNIKLCGTTYKNAKRLLEKYGMEKVNIVVQDNLP